MLNLLYCNPWRPVDARWQRATRLVELGGNEPHASPNRDSGPGSGWIHKAQRFQIALRAAKSYQDQMQVITGHPEIYFAHWIHEVETSSRSVRWAVEARILAGETDQAIANKNGCRAEVIHAYEALFFSVRDRLQHKDFILHAVLGEDLQCGQKSLENGMLWKLFGFLAGPHVLDALMTRVPVSSRVDGPEGVPAYFEHVAIDSVALKAAMAALSPPLKSDGEMRLLKDVIRLAKDKATHAAPAVAHDQIQRNLQSLLAIYPFVATDAKTDSQRRDEESSAVETQRDVEAMTQHTVIVEAANR